MTARTAAWTATLALLLAPMTIAGVPALADGPAPNLAPAPAPLATLLPIQTIGLFDPFDYSDTVLLGNNNSQTSRNLTLYFQSQRGVPDENVLLADLPEAETISEAQWNAFAAWWRNETANRSLGSQINYIVTFKGVPIRVSWTHVNGPGSFQDALMLLDGTYESAIGNVGPAGYNNPYFNRTERFSFEQYGIRLVTGIYAYNESTAMSLIDRASSSLGERGEYVLDTDASKGYAGGWGGYGYANQALIWANVTLSVRGELTLLDLSNTYITNRTGVMGYSSWGSNDCCWGAVTQYARPHNTWVNGSIAETFVSTGGRTFTWPPSYGQSLIADWVDEGVTGVKGYTDEPYIHSIADGHILYGRYSQGYNLAESFWSASHVMGWRQIVIGDPKAAPYADVGDLSFNATLTAAPATANVSGSFDLTVAIENTAAVARDVDLRVSLPDGSSQGATVALPKSAVCVFSLPIDLSDLSAAFFGTQVFSIQVDPNQTVREWDESNNDVSRSVEIRRPPIITADVSPASVPTLDTSYLRLRATRADRPISLFIWRENGGEWLPAAANENSTDIRLTHSRSGTYTYDAYAVDAGGLASQAVSGVVLTVLNRAPQADAFANTTTPLSLEPVRFTAVASTDVDGTVASYLWDAGPLGTWTTVSFDLVFDRPGVYAVNLTVADDEGAQDSAQVVISVQNRPPVAVVRANVSQAFSGVPFLLDGGMSVDPDGTVVLYEFEFDGDLPTSGTNPVAEHTFPSPGITGAWLRITDDAGATASARITLLVLDRAPIIDWSTSLSGNLLEGGELVIWINLTDEDNALFSYAVDYGDGSTASHPLSGREFALTLTHVYALEGEYTISFEVADVDGNLTTLQTDISVVHPAPHATSLLFTVEGREMEVEWSIVSPFGDLVTIIMLIDDLPWRTFHGGNGGVRTISLEGLAPGNHTVRFNVTDGVKETSAAWGTFELLPPEADTPGTPSGGGTNGSPFGLLLPAVIVIAAVCAVAFFLWRRSRPKEPATSQEAS